MKKRIMIISIILIFIVPLKVYALSAPSVEINVDGNIKNGEEVNIVVNMKDLEGLYAASVDFAYDKNDLNIISIAAGDSIKKYEDEIMEIGGEVDASNNKTSYSFTFLGDKKGISGEGTLVVIKAKILNANNFNVGQDSIKVKLVKRAGDSVENYDYNFIGYNEGPSTENSQDSSTKEDVSSEEEEKNNTNEKEEINKNDETELVTDTEDSINNEDYSENEQGSNKVNKEETFLNNILNGNIFGSFIDNIKNFISGNNNKEELIEESEESKYSVDTNKEDNIDNKTLINEDNKENLENNKYKSEQNDENKSSSEDDINNEKNSKVFYENSAILIYISILALITIVGGYCYYNFRKFKSKDN